MSGLWLLPNKTFIGGHLLENVSFGVKYQVWEHYSGYSKIIDDTNKIIWITKTARRKFFQRSPTIKGRDDMKITRTRTVRTSFTYDRVIQSQLFRFDLQTLSNNYYMKVYNDGTGYHIVDIHKGVLYHKSTVIPEIGCQISNSTLVHPVPMNSTSLVIEGDY